MESVSKAPNSPVGDIKGMIGTSGENVPKKK